MYIFKVLIKKKYFQYLIIGMVEKLYFSGLDILAFRPFLCFLSVAYYSKLCYLQDWYQKSSLNILLSSANKE